MARIHLFSGLGSVNVLISRDGTLSTERGVLSEYVNYDRSMIEFGEEMSDLMYFIDYFEKNQLEAVMDPRLLETWTDFVKVGVGFLEHVKHGFSRFYPDSDLIERTIGVLHAWFPFEVSEAEISDMRVEVRSGYFKMPTPEAAPARWVVQAADHILSAALMDNPLAHEEISRAARCAQTAAALYVLQPPFGLNEELLEMMKEQSWQFRRAVDVIDALQEGGSIPDISETK